MRNIEHSAVYRHGAFAAVERLDDTVRQRDLGVARRKCGVDHRHLIRMNGKAAREAIVAGSLARNSKTRRISIVQINRVDGLDAKRMGSEDALRARVRVQWTPSAVGEARITRTER